MKYLVIDCNYLCHRSRFSKDYVDKENNVVYGFLNMLINSIEELDTNNLIFIWDSKSSIREKHFPDYKKKRKDLKKEKTTEEKAQLKKDYAQFELIKDSILPAIGYRNILLQEGLEGDDLMGYLALNKKYKNDEFVLIANDQDLYQLLSTRCSIYIPNKGKYTFDDFKEEFGIGPNQWGEVKAIGGCTSDCVPGIPGVGEKTVCKYLNGTLKPTTVAHKKIVSAEGQAVAEFNRPLVVLPHKETKKVKLKKEKGLSLKALKKICKELDLYDFYRDREDEWSRAFAVKK